jgi:Uma2 family endonuclease
MTQAQVRFPSFEAYLSYSNAMDMEGRYELTNGELVELPPESRLNSTIAVRILLLLVAAGIPVELIHPGKCEVQVPILQPQDSANRFPDLVVLRQEHLQLTQKRLTITLEMPPPRLIVEVLSPGKPNQERDYIYKRAQYAAIGVPEYWLLDPVAQTVLVLTLEGKDYREMGLFKGNDTMTSVEFAELQLAVGQIFEAGI